MQAHRYATGQTVLFKPSGNPLSERGWFKIVSKMPERDNQPQYRIKNEANGQERVVVEGELEVTA